MHIYRYIPALLLAVAAAAGAIPVHDAWQNAEFALPLDSGWTALHNDIVGTHVLHILKSGGVRVGKTMCGRAALVQEVKLPSTAFAFTTRAKFSAEATKPEYYSYSAVVLAYEDKTGRELGQTRIQYGTDEAPAQSGPTLHVIPVPDSATWTDYTVNIADELKKNLKGIAPSKVARLRVAFEAFNSGETSC
jgi:hypothetical protein